MSQSSLMGRLGRIFRRQSNDELPLEREIMDDETAPAVVTRSTFLRPWAKRDQAISNLQHGFDALSDLLTSVRDNLQRQGQRQDELLQYMSHLPQALESLPESNRVQSETLKAIHMQLASQSGQASKLGEILDKLSQSSTGSRQALDELNQRVQDMSRQDEHISQVLGSVGTAIQDVSRTNQTSAGVLQQMRDNLDQRDGQLERILLKQNTRFTTLLSIAIVLSMAAIAAVAALGYLLWQRGSTL
ncbi:MAG: hypothetical protein IT448_02630 [Phycisphaerales bacterium]|nr:hypothetical protein [Phycisphaerales bacterium]